MVPTTRSVADHDCRPRCPPRPPARLVALDIDGTTIDHMRRPLPGGPARRSPTSWRPATTSSSRPGGPSSPPCRSSGCSSLETRVRGLLQRRRDARPGPDRARRGTRITDTVTFDPRPVLTMLRRADPRGVGRRRGPRRRLQGQCAVPGRRARRRPGRRRLGGAGGLAAGDPGDAPPPRRVRRRSSWSRSNGSASTRSPTPSAGPPGSTSTLRACPRVRRSSWSGARLRGRTRRHGRRGRPAQRHRDAALGGPRRGHGAGAGRGQGRGRRGHRHRRGRRTRVGPALPPLTPALAS